MQTVFKKIDYTLDSLLHEIEHGAIGLPDIQRPFVWKAARQLTTQEFADYQVSHWSNAT